MNPKLIVLLLYVTSEMKIVKGKCKDLDFCNLEDCSKDPPYRNDENKLDRACISNKCNFDFEFSDRPRQCVPPHNCTDGQYCSDSPGCQDRPLYGPENDACIAGLNCNRVTGRCVKKPKCKDGEYCKRGDCEGDDGKPTVRDDDACEDGSKCNASFKCVKKSTIKKGSKRLTWFIFGFVTCLLLAFGILGSLWFFLYYRKNTKNFIKEKKATVSTTKEVKKGKLTVSTVKEVKEKKPKLSTVKEVKENKPTVSTVKEVKEKKPKLSTVKEVKENKPTVSTVKEVKEEKPSVSTVEEEKSNLDVTAQKSTSSIPGKSKSESPILSREFEKRRSTKPKPKDRNFLKDLGEW